MAKTFASGFEDWTPDRLPDLTGKSYFITGANSGIGSKQRNTCAPAMLTCSWVHEMKVEDAVQ